MPPSYLEFQILNWCLFQAEIEHFLDPLDKSHPKFKIVKDVKIKFYTCEAQMAGTDMQHITVGEALEKGVIENETMG